MRNKINYTDESLYEFRAARDFLPSPEKRAFKEEYFLTALSECSSMPANQLAFREESEPRGWMERKT